MAALPQHLQVDWVIPGKPTDPTVLAFTGFGHRLDPWRRLRVPGWRVGVIEFPVGTPPSQVWTPAAMTARLAPHWSQAACRVLMSFSFGAAGATAVTRELSEAEPSGHIIAPKPQLAIHIAPVQWARIPWPVLRRVPLSMRLPALKQVAKGGGALMAMAGRSGGHSIREFVQLVDRHVGWEFVAFYLPYLDWIDGTKTTLATWDQAPWPNHLFGASDDRVIPVKGMRAQQSLLGTTVFHETSGMHFNAVDAARPHITTLLTELLEAQPTT